ncbi:MAG: hypothetical protein JWO31_4165 [Phycisphaerales bacterium]|nr:hypothetical protein [Phycisphaerales bacterium]
MVVVGPADNASGFPPDGGRVRCPAVSRGRLALAALWTSMAGAFVLLSWPARPADGATMAEVVVGAAFDATLLIVAGRAAWNVVRFPFDVRVGFREAERADRARTGRCLACGYDLRVTPVRCPECGADPKPN